MISSRAELEALLCGNIDVEQYTIIVWGTGNTASLYLEGIHRIELNDLIKGYADNNEAKWGKTFDGKKIYSPDEIKQMENVLVLIASPNPKVIKSVAHQLEENAIKWMHIDEYVLKTHSEEVLDCYDLLEDDFSKKTYAGLVDCKINGKYPDLSIIDRDQYFSFEYFADYNPTETYVDCGAYVGDTIEKYIWKMDGAFNKIIAFEPDRSNLQAIDYRLDRLRKEWNIADDKIMVYPYGVSDKNSTTFVERYDNNNGFGTKVLSEKSDKAEECQVVSIDEFINDEIGFIKADIESYEYKLLEGAKNSIAQYSPKLAICIYHNVVDFYQIPLLIKKINPKYKLAVRHYTSVLSETIVYAYIKED